VFRIFFPPICVFSFFLGDFGVCCLDFLLSVKSLFGLCAYGDIMVVEAVTV